MMIIVAVAAVDDPVPEMQLHLPSDQPVEAVPGVEVRCQAPFRVVRQQRQQPVDQPAGQRVAGGRL